jgi:ABC-2 type transport system ATP-binding protein
VGKNELHKLIRQINVDRDVTILLVTHDVLDIERLCNRVMIIDKGSLIWHGGIEDLKRAKGVEKHYHVVYETPCAPIEASFLKAIQTDGQRHHYICTEDVPLDKILPQIMSVGRVIDFTVTDPPLDQVMRRIYTE